MEKDIDEYEYEYEYEYERAQPMGDQGNGAAYRHQPRYSELTEEDYKAWYKPKITQDTNVELMRAELRQPDPGPAIFKRLDNVEMMTFNWEWHWTSNARKGQARDRLRLGSIWTQTQKHQIWGVMTAQEFKNHLHFSDRKEAYHWIDQLQCQVSQISSYRGSHALSYWIAKDHNAQSLAGWWAIGMDDCQKNIREICVRVNGELESYPVQINTVNSIKV